MRKTRDLERESNLLAEIIAKFRDGSSQDISRMIALVRSVSSVEEAKEALERDGLSEAPEESSNPSQSERETLLAKPAAGLPRHDDPSMRLTTSSHYVHSTSSTRKHDTNPLSLSNLISHQPQPP